MTSSEFKRTILETVNPNWFNNIEFNLELTHLDQNVHLVGFSDLHSFANKQVTGWDKYEIVLPYELLKSRTYFQNIIETLEDFIRRSSTIEEDSTLIYSFNVYKDEIENISNRSIFLCDSAKTIFLVGVYKELPENFPPALSFLLGKSDYPNTHENFVGYLLAYEFLYKDKSSIVERREKEKTSIKRLVKDFQDQLPQLEKQLTDHLINSKEKYKEYVTIIDDFKIGKEKLYTDWFINTKGDFESFTNTSDTKIKELEETYKEKLKLEAPAKYWSDRAVTLRKQGWISLGILVGLVLTIVCSLGGLLWNTPEQIYNSFFDGDKSAAIRWSIIYVTFISFMAFGIKAVSKVMFSSFHLARDAEERYTLTYFYLSLLKDSSVDKDEKQLIIQSLFSRADTGLLKEDSSPTMPNDLAGKILSR